MVIAVNVMAGLLDDGMPRVADRSANFTAPGPLIMAVGRHHRLNWPGEPAKPG